MCSQRADRLVIAVATGATGDGDRGTQFRMHPRNENRGDPHHARHMTRPGSASFRPYPQPSLATGGRADGVLSVGREPEASPCKKPEPGTEWVLGICCSPSSSMFLECSLSASVASGSGAELGLSG